MLDNIDMKDNVQNRKRQIGLNIAFYRRMKNMSQETLASEVMISRQWLAALESPSTDRMCSVDVLLNIADALGIPPARLFDFKDL